MQNEIEKDPESVNSLLGKGMLGQIVGKAQRILEADKCLQACLPEEMRPHCHVMTASSNTITIEASSPAWSAQLHFVLPELLQKMREFAPFKQLQHIHYRVQG